MTHHYPRDWKDLYDALVTPKISPDDILLSCTRPRSLLLRMLRGKRLRQRLALKEELAMSKCRQAMFFAAGTVGNKLFDALYDTADGTKIRSCREILQQIKQYLEMDRRTEAQAEQAMQPASAQTEPAETGQNLQECASTRKDSQQLESNGKIQSVMVKLLSPSAQSVVDSEQADTTNGACETNDLAKCGKW